MNLTVENKSTTSNGCKQPPHIIEGSILKSPGFTINLDAIASGMLEIILGHPDGKCLTFGMLPAEIMECLEQNIDGKIPAFYTYTKIEEEWADELFNSYDGQALRRVVIKEVSNRIYTLAAKRGLMWV